MINKEELLKVKSKKVTCDKCKKLFNYSELMRSDNKELYCKKCYFGI